MSNLFLEKTRGKLIVSCQALAGEPLHGSEIMARMADAAMRGGAAGIRANTVADITAIKKMVALPIIGIIKKVYGDSSVYITPTAAEVDALVGCGVEVIAMDATKRPRPDGSSLAQTFLPLREKYPDTVFMADCSTFEEAQQAQALGFNIVGTTLRGYTEYTSGAAIPDMALLRRLGAEMRVPVIAEGGIWTPEQLREILSIPGIHAAVIGGAITRPMEITKHFVGAIPTHTQEPGGGA